MEYYCFRLALVGALTSFHRAFLIHDLAHLYRVFLVPGCWSSQTIPFSRSLPDLYYWLIAVFYLEIADLRILFETCSSDVEIDLIQYWRDSRLDDKYSSWRQVELEASNDWRRYIGEDLSARYDWFAQCSGRENHSIFPPFCFHFWPWLTPPAWLTAPARIRVVFRPLTSPDQGAETWNREVKI